jgi:hypothetical protein
VARKQSPMVVIGVVPASMRATYAPNASEATWFAAN